MYTADNVRDRYASGLDTAPGPTVVTMCFDRIDRDLSDALGALTPQGDAPRIDHDRANKALGHAQDLVSELATMLDTTRWEHAGALLSVYDYLLRRMALANATKNASTVREVQGLVAELGSAFRTAAQETTAATPTLVPAPPPADHTDPDVGRPSLSVRA